MAKISGGDKLKAALDEISKKVSKASSVEVGFLEGSTNTEGVSLPMIAAIQEFGAPKAGIPPRPFFRTMIKEKSDEWPDAIGNLLVENEYDTEKTMRQTGAAIKGQLQQSIIDTMNPPLSDVTLMLRKMRADDPDLVVTGSTVAEARRRVAEGERASGVSTKPLVDTGSMLNSVDYNVK